MLPRVVVTVAAVLALVMWQLWRSTDPALESVEFTPQARVGLTDGPADTRLFFSYPNVFSDRTSLRIVLGQAVGPGAEQVRYRIELSGLNTREVHGCDHDGDAENVVTVCGEGKGTGKAEPDDYATSLVLTGKFSSHDALYIDVDGLFLYAIAKGPYRLYQQELLPLTNEPVSDLHFPARGVEVEPEIDVDPGNRRYDSFTPEPYRLYPDGWAFLVQRPGGPVDIRVTDIAGEAEMRRRRDFYSLLTGIFVGLAAEGLMVLAFNREEATRPAD